MIKLPSQQIYDACFKTCAELGYDVYDYLPDDATKYPFVFMAETNQVDDPTKTQINGYVYQTIHVYGLKNSRVEVTNMANAILAAFRKLKAVETMHIALENNYTNIRTILDTSTKTQLWHSVIDVRFRFF